MKIIILIAFFYTQFAIAGTNHLKSNSRKIELMKTTLNFKLASKFEYSAYSTYHIFRHPDYTPRELFNEFTDKIWTDIDSHNKNITGYMALWKDPKFHSDPTKKGDIADIQVVVGAITAADMPVLKDFLNRMSSLVIAGEKVNFQPITGVVYSPRILMTAANSVIDERGKWSLVNIEDTDPMDQIFDDLERGLKKHDKNIFMSAIPKLFPTDVVASVDQDFDTAKNILVECDMTYLKTKGRNQVTEPALPELLVWWPQ